LLFVLRGVDPADLISKASAAQAVRQTVGKVNGLPAMNDAEMAEVFGIELESGKAASAPLDETSPPSPPTIPGGPPIRAARSARNGTRRNKAPRKFSAKDRASLAAMAKTRWQRAKARRRTVA
jgi:hypothetical protein